MRVLVVPGAPALLPRYASLLDPLEPVRDAVAQGLSWLLADAERVAVLAGEHGAEVGSSLLNSAGFRGPVTLGPPTDEADVLVVADGSARRGEKAPGHLDPRAFAFDEEIGTALGAGDLATLGTVDLELAADLLASVSPLVRLASLLKGPIISVDVDYAGDPYGVQYWVVRWQCES